MQSLVSIIIPNYNKATYIIETIYSVLKQTYTNYEVIIVDDGSTDNSKTILETINHPKIQLFYKNNTGVCDTRNFAISKAQGVYILPLDADDLIEPTFLEKTVSYLNNNPNCLIVQTVTEKFGDESGVYNLPDFSMKQMLTNNLIINTALFRKQNFDQTKGYSNDFNKGLEDWAFWLDILKQGGTVHKIMEPLFKYRIILSSRNHTINPNETSTLRELICLRNIELYNKYFPLPLYLHDKLTDYEIELAKYKKSIYYKIRTLLKLNRV